MTNTVYELEWKGPVHFLGFLEFPKDISLKQLQLELCQEGVYVLKHHLPGNTKKKAFYVGKADCLIERFFQHVGSWFSGDYSIHKIKNNVTAYHRVDRPENLETGSAEFSRFLEMSWEEILNTDLFFTRPKPSKGEKAVPTKELEYIEFALIKKFKECSDTPDNPSNVVAIQSGKGGK